MPNVPPLSELHWFPLYVRDFLSSPSVQRMTDRDVGRYVRLLLRAWDDGTKTPTLSIADLKGASAAVRECFFNCGEVGRIHNPRLTEIWREQQERHAKAVKKARHAANVRHSKSPKHAPSMPDASHSSMESRESIKTLSQGGAGAVPDGGPAPASESGIVERREAPPVKGMWSLGQLVPRFVKP